MENNYKQPKAPNLDIKDSDLDIDFWKFNVFNNNRNNKLEVKLLETKYYIKFINSLDNDFIYHIPKDALDDTVLIHGVLYSKWVYTLKDKSWCTNEILYQLAITIKRTFPFNKIDWDLQLYMIECELHNRKNFSKIKRMFDEESRLMGHYNIENDFALKFNKEDNLKYINKIIFDVNCYYEDILVKHYDTLDDE